MTDPVSRLGEIKARRAKITKGPGHLDDVGWLLEHIEQLQVEVLRLLAQRDVSRRRERELWEQRQAVLDLCDREDAAADRRGRLWVEGKKVPTSVSVNDLREALGAVG